jgi:predicted transcriptional regulator
MSFLMKEKLTPTARLVLVTIKQANRPLSYMELAIDSGCSLAALHVAIPTLERQGLITRLTEGQVHRFSLPTVSEVVDGK